MKNAITINNQDLALRQYNGQMVITFRDIDLVHNRPQGTARRNFNTNKSHFIEGEDYFKISPNEFRTAIGTMDKRQQNDVTLITESGYLMLVKSFTDDLSWEVQRQLVKAYFRYKKPLPEPKPAKEYEYFDKTYNGEAVLTSSDVEYLTKINRATIDWYLRTKCVKGKDYYYTTGDELKKYKTENPKVSRLLSALYLITREGFIKICRAYGVQIDTPKCFEVKKKQNNDFPISKLINKLKREYGYDISVKSLTQEIADEYTDGIIRNQSLTVKIHNKYYIFVDDSAPLPNRRFLAAQGIGCVISGQLRGKCRCLVTEYSNSTLSFASAFMAMLMMSND